MKPAMNSIELSQQDQPARRNATAPPPLADVIARAVNQAATDVHIDMWGHQAALRFRVDGFIHDEGAVSYDEARRLINQIKVAANLDMTTAPVQQEGHFRWYSQDRCRDIRATVVITAPRHESAQTRF